MAQNNALPFDSAYMIFTGKYSTDPINLSLMNMFQMLELHFILVVRVSMEFLSVAQYTWVSSKNRDFFFFLPHT